MNATRTDSTQGNRSTSEVKKPEVATRLAWVIDDDPAIQHFIERAMAEAGLQSVAFLDGDSVLAALEATIKPPDVISVDITMPGASGFSLIRAIRSRRGFEHVAMIVCTGRADVGDAVLASKLRASFVMKPFRLREYIATVEQAIEHSGPVSVPRLR
jgi:DNA-binding NtrC family response regulator